MHLSIPRTSSLILCLASLLLNPTSFSDLAFIIKSLSSLKPLIFDKFETLSGPNYKSETATFTLLKDKKIIESAKTSVISRSSRSKKK